MEELSVTIKIEKCPDCPYFKSRQVDHWLTYPQKAYEYTCKKADKFITHEDGINPPPIWCPLRK